MKVRASTNKLKLFIRYLPVIIKKIISRYAQSQWQSKKWIVFKLDNTFPAFLIIIKIVVVFLNFTYR